MTPAEQPRTLSFEELTVWRTESPDVKFAVLPPGNTRPNPLIADDKLFVSAPMFESLFGYLETGTRKVLRRVGLFP